ncbi:EAL domain-containing protein [Paenibacillus sp. sgz302251]|uniref:EAL domain-containing protein n=1 Tax=Paenibacillus sp. sgz302251 TaxID=3414493 RepID=UPI003C7D581E
MNVQVVAEGVEDLGQLDRIRELHCDIVQGYYFSPPLDMVSLRTFLNRSYGEKEYR